MPANPWIETYQPRPEARIRFFCFPYAGGSAQVFRHWGKKFPDWVEVSALQYPGRWNRHSETLHCDHVSMANAIVTSLKSETKKPFACFGHSMGGMLAYETCRRLQAASLSLPLFLSVSAVEAPQTYSGLKNPTFHLSDEALTQRIRELGGAPEEVLNHSGMLRALLPILRADLQVIENYRWESGEKLKCPLLALAGTEDPEVSIDQMKGWREQTEAAFRLEEISGGHFFLQTQEARVIGILNKELEKYS